MRFRSGSVFFMVTLLCGIGKYSILTHIFKTFDENRGHMRARTGRCDVKRADTVIAARKSAENVETLVAATP
jgi:hypothetical protein